MHACLVCDMRNEVSAVGPKGSHGVAAHLPLDGRSLVPVNSHHWGSIFGTRKGRTPLGERRLTDRLKCTFPERIKAPAGSRGSLSESGRYATNKDLAL
jgi:hypothetical protein